MAHYSEIFINEFNLVQTWLKVQVCGQHSSSDFMHTCPFAVTRERERERERGGGNYMLGR